MVKSVLLAALFMSAGLPAAWAASFSVPSGTTLHCRLTQTLTTRLSLQGEAFTATVSEPVVVDGRALIPLGATVRGRIARMQEPGRIRGVGEMRLLPESITFPDGRKYPLSALLMSAYGVEGARVAGEEGTIKGPSSRLKTFEEIGGLAAGGGIFGLLIHHPLFGMTVGGAAGFLDRVRKRGKDLVLPSGTQLNYQLTRVFEIQ